MLSTEKKLSIVMPAYNEGEHIYQNLQIVSLTISKFIRRYEIIAVNDGSQDDTKSEIMRCMKNDTHIHIVSYKKNHGKGNAIKCGVSKATGDFIAFLDSDLDIPPSQIEQYMIPLINDKADVVIGSKMHKESKLEYPLIRKIISYGYYCMLKILFRLGVKDTQTVLKFIKADALKASMPLIRTQGFAYDIEILVALNCRKYRIMEMPVKLVFRRGKGMGRIKLKDILKVFKDTWAIFYRANLRKSYDK